MTDNAPKSVNELVQFITGYVSDEYARTQRAVNGTRLAEAIRRKYPDISYEELGLTRLADVIRIGQREGLLHRSTDVSHLEVSPGVGDSSRPPSPNEPGSPSLRYIRPEIFKALMFFQRNTNQYFDRMTARVIECDASETANSEKLIGEPERYVRIEMIPPTVQQDWMQQYLNSAGVVDTSEAPIQSERWWTDFPAWLERTHPELLPGWRAYRVQSIISFTREWAGRNKVPVSAVLTERPYRPLPNAGDAAGLPAPVGTLRLAQAAKPRSEGGGLRALILSAIGQMTDEELAGFLLRHFKAR